MATAAAKAPQAAADAPKKSKLPLIIVLVVVLLAGAGGAAWFMMRGSADEAEEDTKAAAKPSIFLPLDQFTVNLQPDDGQQFLQVAMTLKVVDQQTSDAIKAALPEVRSRVLLLLSSKKPSQLISLEGKNRLAEEIIYEIEHTMPFEKKKKKKKRKPKAEESAEEAKGAAKVAAAEGTEAKEGKSRKAKAKEEPEEEEELPERVLAVFFTHFIIQ